MIQFIRFGRCTVDYDTQLILHNTRRSFSSTIKQLIRDYKFCCTSPLLTSLQELNTQIISSCQLFIHLFLPFFPSFFVSFFGTKACRNTSHILICVYVDRTILICIYVERKYQIPIRDNRSIIHSFLSFNVQR